MFFFSFMRDKICDQFTLLKYTLWCIFVSVNNQCGYHYNQDIEESGVFCFLVCFDFVLATARGTQDLSSATGG